MVLNDVIARFVEHSPITVMAQLALQRALEPQWLDALFDEHRQRQYSRQLLFSTTVDLMSLVALGLRPSVHAAAQASKDLSVSLASLYAKINHTEPQLMRAMVRGSAERLLPVLEAIRPKRTPLIGGYRTRVLDGNHLPASDKRLGPLRNFRGAALPGLALVVYDPDLGLVVDVVPGEDGHAQERTLMPAILQTAKRGELWLADRNFSTRAILFGLNERGAAFIVREHATSPNPTACGRARKVGRIETGAVYEQVVEIANGDEPSLRLRRVQIHLDTPTEDGDKVIGLLSNLPRRVSAKKIARSYRERWSIERMFQRLESVLQSEVRSLGYPKAALLALCVAVVAYNVLSVLQGAIERQHHLSPDAERQVSSYYVAAEVRANYGGMMIAVPQSAWKKYQALSSRQLCQVLMHIAAKVDLESIRKHPRGPKATAKIGYAPGHVARRHVCTARILRAGKIDA